jgi:hypothetical protein
MQPMTKEPAMKDQTNKRKREKKWFEHLMVKNTIVIEETWLSSTKDSFPLQGLTFFHALVLKCKELLCKSKGISR